MPSTQEFRRRIKSVASTRQITKAMEMIASIKMQKATRQARLTRTYTQNAWDILRLLTQKTLEQNHILLSGNFTGTDKTAVILITSDKGLCGSYNSEVIKKFIGFKSDPSRLGLAEAEIRMTNDESQITNNDSIDIIAIGKVGASYVNRYGVGKLVAEFKGYDNNIRVEDVMPVSKLTTDEYLANRYSRVVVIYSHFVSSLKQVPVVKQILPIVEDHLEGNIEWAKPETDIETEFEFEPSPDSVLDGVLRQILISQIYGAVLEANASEHSARMVAMKNATDNATDLVDELKLIYNSIRQSNITSEIAEISGATEAMK